MNLQIVLIPFLFLSVFTSTSLFAQDFKALYQKDCAMCHELTDPNLVIAPPMMAIVSVYKKSYPQKEAFVKHTLQFILSPSRQNSLMGEKTIKQYGLMISQKGAMPEKELEALIAYLYDKY